MGPGVGVVYAVDEGVKGAGGAQVGGKLDRVVVERRVDELPSGGGGSPSLLGLAANLWRWQGGCWREPGACASWLSA